MPFVAASSTCIQPHALSSYVALDSVDQPDSVGDILRNTGGDAPRKQL